MTSKNRTSFNPTFNITPAVASALMRIEAVKQAIRSSLAQLGVRGTPTVLVVDSSGTIRRAFVGQLNEQGERQLVSLLGSALGLVGQPTSRGPG